VVAEAGEDTSRGTATGNPDAKLAEAQFEIAKRYGFSSWRALKEHLDSLTLEGQIIETARKGHAERLARLLD
jgi:hypothetical protein